MNAIRAIKYHIIKQYWEQAGIPASELDEEGIDDTFDDYESDYQIQDLMEAFRTSGEETGLPCEWSRHYESEAVGAQLSSGEWVGWTYWYGGGKHGEPEAIDWLDDAYFLDVKEEEKLVIVRTFEKEENVESKS